MSATARRTAILLFAGLWSASCGPSVDELVDELENSGEKLEMAKQELLIAKNDAIPELLDAFEDEGRSAVRVELAEVLAGLFMRLEDKSIAEALRRHILSDPNPAVRARISRELGMLKRVDFADEFMQAASDTSGEVRGEAFRALNQTKHKLSESQLEILIAKAHASQEDESRDVRLEARMIVADKVDEWLREARKSALKGTLAESESLYTVALDYSPTDKKASFMYGRFLHTNGREEEGLEVWRRSGWLLDIPLVAEAPVIDGHLDDAVWEQAVRTGPFYTWSNEHNAAQLSEHPTDVAILYTQEALYFGAFCEEPYPDSITVSTHERDQQEEYLQDLVEFFFDIDRDQKNSCKVTVNSRGIITDSCVTMPNWRDHDHSWSVESEAAGHVGDDFWSVEYRVLFGQEGMQYETEIPYPVPGSLWAIDIQRGYRAGVNWSQWTRTYPDMWPQESYGFFLF